MSQKLKTHGFKKMSNKELENWNIIPDGEGCILHVDLSYTIKLHDHYSDYPYY